MKNTNQTEKLRHGIKVAAVGAIFFAAIVCFGMHTLKNEQSITLKTVSESEYEADNISERSEDSETNSLNDSVKDVEKKADESNIKIYVHICGAVAAPGVYEFSEGSRLYEAVEKAGGMTSEAAGEYINLAQLIEDGQKIWIPSIEEIKKYQENGTDISHIGIINKAGINAGAANTYAGTSEGGTSSTAGIVNLNTASRDELMTLNGIGASRADAILAYREEKGKFQKVEDIMKVPGIKNAAFQKIKDKITV